MASGCITGLLLLLLVESISMAPYSQEQHDAPSDSDYHPSLNEDDAGASFGASEDIAIKNARAVPAGCPPGLWCGKKRELALHDAPRDSDYQPSLNEDDAGASFGASDDIAIKNARAVPAGCPPGLWCGKKRELALHDAPRDSDYQPSLNEDDAGASFGASDDIAIKNARAVPAGCPPGLWCGKKRELAPQIERSQVQREDNAWPEKMETNRAKAKRCPPGLWCGKWWAFTLFRTVIIVEFQLLDFVVFVFLILGTCLVMFLGFCMTKFNSIDASVFAPLGQNVKRVDLKRELQCNELGL